MKILLQRGTLKKVPFSHSTILIRVIIFRMPQRTSAMDGCHLAITQSSGSLSTYSLKPCHDNQICVVWICVDRATRRDKHIAPEDMKLLSPTSVLMVRELHHSFPLSDGCPCGQDGAPMTEVVLLVWDSCAWWAPAWSLPWVMLRHARASSWWNMKYSFVDLRVLEPF